MNPLSERVTVYAQDTLPFPPVALGVKSHDTYSLNVSLKSLIMVTVSVTVSGVQCSNQEARRLNSYI